MTLFDEPYAGLDPMARQLFYDRYLADYTERPRTVLLSTHLIDEAAGLLERVVVIDSGWVVLDPAADEIRGAATRVSGPAIGVAEFTAGRGQRRLGVGLHFFRVAHILPGPWYLTWLPRWSCWPWCLSMACGSG